MKKLLYSKYDKSLIKDLPRVLFEGRIVVVVSQSEAQRAVDYLLAQPILGVDTETRPSFKKGVIHKVALLQVASHDTCFLFRLNYTGMTADIIRLLEDTTVPKIGLSLHDDLMMLHKIAGFTPGNFIELQHCVRELGIEDLSLQKLYANFFGQKISKTQRLTNWEADVLNDRQKLYAATDAWTCIKLYEELQRLKQTGEYELIKTDNNDNVQTDISKAG
ncbi:MAG: 3'-5' exonuclease domain-containing protein 2 [Prevotella sp.]|nr:3'-5' exonuclease domain-containing protein 2 [Prevotella sp.]